MTLEQFSIFQYIKTISHVYLDNERYVWCVAKQETNKVYLYKDKKFNGIRGRCDGCGMIVGK